MICCDWLLSCVPFTWEFRWINLTGPETGLGGGLTQNTVNLQDQFSWPKTFFLLHSNTVHFQRLMVFCCLLAFIQSQAEWFVDFCILLSGLVTFLLKFLLRKGTSLFRAGHDFLPSQWNCTGCAATFVSRHSCWWKEHHLSWLILIWRSYMIGANIWCMCSKYCLLHSHKSS